MRINHNISSMVTQSAINRVNRGLSKSLERLSTGLRINRASDDAAGLSVSENLRSQINGTQMAVRNAQDGTALLQIAEGAANEISSMLQRMRELAVQAANDTLTATERGYLNVEFKSLQDEVDRIANSTQYNTQCLINGTGFGVSSGSSSILHIGPNKSTSIDQLQIGVDAITSGALSISSGTIRVTSGTFATSALSNIDSAISSVNNMRADLGAYVNRLEHAVDNLNNQRHNMQAADSLIRDADFASETAEFTKNQILMQSGLAMLSQSNAMPQNVLALLVGTAR